MDESTTREEYTVDIGELIGHYNYVREKLWPLRLLAKGVTKVRSWNNYPVSLAVVTLVCVAVFLPRVLVALLSAVLFAVILAGNKYFPKSKHKAAYQKPPDVVPQLINEDKESLKATASAQRSRQQALKEFRQLLKSTDDMLVLMGTFVDRIKGVFVWENEKHSIRVLVILFVLVIILMWVPVSALISCSVAFFFCWNDSFFSNTKRICRCGKLPSLKDEKRMVEDPPSTIDDENDSSSPLSTDSLKDDLSNSVDSMGGAGGGTQTGANTSPSKRDKQGVCHKCGSAYNILKRKHQCSNCGYFYCGNCTDKVTRSHLGATSPAAFQETVRVCHECKEELGTRNHSPTTAK